MTEEVNNLQDNSQELKAELDTLRAELSSLKEKNNVLDSVKEQVKQEELQKENTIQVEKQAEENLFLRSEAGKLGNIYAKIFNEYDAKKNALGGNSVVNSLIKRDFLKTFYEQQAKDNFKNMLVTTKARLDKFFLLSEEKQIKNIDSYYDSIDSTIEYTADKQKAYAKQFANHNTADSYFNHFKSNWIKNFVQN